MNATSRGKPCRDCAGVGGAHSRTCPARLGITPRDPDDFLEPLLTALALAQGSASGNPDAEATAQSLAHLVQGREFVEAFERVAVVIYTMSGWLGQALAEVDAQGGNSADLVDGWGLSIPPAPRVGESR